MHSIYGIKILEIRTLKISLIGSFYFQKPQVASVIYNLIPSILTPCLICNHFLYTDVVLWLKTDVI